SYESVQPVSMGSAGLKYGPDGKVAWGDIWETFCDLAMAGGPPHKGTLLAPGSAAAIAAQPDRYQEVTAEICRGVALTTGLAAQPSTMPGWVRVSCYTEGMAGWLLRAIVMENIAARAESRTLDLPAAPAYRLEKEIKNVVTVIAKTCHYWLGHMPRLQQRAIAAQFAQMATESPLIEPDMSGDGVRTDGGRRATDRLASLIQRDTGLREASHQYEGWLGIDCPNAHAAIWMMRALVVTNILSRREGTTLFVPVNPTSDPDGYTVAGAVAQIYQFAAAKGVVSPVGPLSPEP
ncbi:MAG: hypothetical protein ABI652_01990, partial [Acidobacteriota bacterium]